MNKQPRALCALSLMAFLTLSGAARADGPATSLDAYGSPLPPGAIARLGATRLRQVCTCLAWAPDGKTFASAGADGSVRIWDASSGKQLRQIRKPGSYWLVTIAFTADGKYLIAGGVDGAVHILDAAADREVRILAPPAQSASQRITALALRPREGTILTLCAASKLLLWDTTTGKIVHQEDVAPNKTLLARQALSPDGRCYCVWVQPDTLTVYRANGKELFHAPTRFTTVDGFAFSADGKTLAVSSAAASQIALWDVGAGKELHRFESVSVHGPALTFSPDGKWLAGKGRDGSLYVWSAASGKVRRRFELPLSRTIITANGDCPLAFSPDGKTLAAAHGLTIHLWDVEANKELHESIGHLVPVEDVRFSADGQRILTCSREETYQWETTTAKLLHRRARGAVGYPPPVVAVDDAAVIVAQASGLNRWNVETGQAADRALVSGLSGSIIRLNRSSNGKTLAGYTSDHFIHLWDAQSGKERSKWKAEQTSRPVLALSADGALLAIAYANTTVRLWDVAAGREIRQFNDGVPPPSVSEVASPGQIIRSASAVSRMAFSPDGKALLTVRGAELTFWEVATGRSRVNVPRPTAFPGVIFSPDGNVVAEGTISGTVRLLDATNGWELTELPGDASAVWAMAFSPNGSKLASAYADGTVLIWGIKDYTSRKKPTTLLGDKKLFTLWNDLSEADASRAYKALLALAASPKTAAPYLEKRLADIDAERIKRTAQLIADLDNDQRAARDRAQEQLEKMGDAVRPAMRQAVRANPPVETKRRLLELLDQRKQATLVSDGVRSLRALEALERSAAPEAIQALGSLAKDAANADVKHQAAASLDRLTRRIAAP